MHVVSQVLGVIMLFVACILPRATARMTQQHPAHQGIGILVMVLVCLQAAVGLVRPSAALPITVLRWVCTPYLHMFLNHTQMRCYYVCAVVGAAAQVLWLCVCHPWRGCRAHWLSCDEPASR